MKTVWLLSYPRSGNSMLASMMLASMPDVSFESAYDGEDDAPRFLRELDKLGVKPSPSPRWVIKKTHDIAHVNSEEKVIWLVRDGCDAMVSYWKHHERVNAIAIDPIDFFRTRSGPANDGVCAMWDEFVRYAQLKLSITDHVTIRYEDLVIDPVDTLAKVAGFLDTSFDDTRLSLVSFDRLHAVNSGFYRKGTIGSSAEIGVMALKWLHQKMRPELSRLGYLSDSFSKGAGI
jgi:hypothetical protein